MVTLWSRCYILTWAFLDRVMEAADYLKWAGPYYETLRECFLWFPGCNKKMFLFC